MTTHGVRQGCLLSPVLFNLFLERIIQKTFHDHHTSISFSGRPVYNLRFADTIDLMGGSNKEHQDLINSIFAKAGDYGMEISAEKSKVMVNNTKNISTNITMKGKQLEEMTSFKYFGATLSKYGTCKAEIRSQIATATAVIARLNRV